MPSTLKRYYYVTKPGIIKGNLIPLFAAFIYASHRNIHFPLLLFLVMGTALIIASGSVFNNLLDKNIDIKMNRTKQRAIVTGEISKNQALIYATILGFSGLSLLAIKVNLLTALVGVSGIFSYVIIYGMAKRMSPYGTLVGSISGATPPLAGYVAVTGSVDVNAVILFLILIFWQMPHFFAIALFRSKEYSAAHIPVWPLVRGRSSTIRQMRLFIILFGLAGVSLTVFGSAGLPNAIIAVLITGYWLAKAFSNSSSTDYDQWARKMFGVSLLALLAICASISLSPFLGI